MVNEQVKKWGELEGKDVLQYTLANKKGVTVKILNYGGTITDIITPGKTGEKGNVILCFDSLEGYLQKNNPFFGCLVGRYANRIANARFSLNGKVYQLAPNNNGNTLHGGIKGFDKKVWDAVFTPESASLQLTYKSPDGEEGYPGNLTVTVVYTLSEESELIIDYTAVTDAATPVNLTNHAYFNLSAGSDATVLDHELMLRSGYYTTTNDKVIPTGDLVPVKNTPYDFTSPKKIGKDIAATGNGYDHNFVLGNNTGKLQTISTLYHAASGRLMETATTQPGVQLYTGNYLDGSLQHTPANIPYHKHAGVCLETQHYPDSPNQPAFPDSILRPGEKYHQITVYKFSVK
ncbi:aldose epimerase family protein [Agriterribacter sp.]|uniref:aldose epimerase family protein n=1 Tax=Agriterribacter sp. TaxID=2821509 RepID=UPI002D1FA856|nr:aldose epimerase family protein [Agriterribacter sp.]